MLTVIMLANLANIGPERQAAVRDASSDATTGLERIDIGQVFRATGGRFVAHVPGRAARPGVSAVSPIAI
jgi:hypothetical protein